MKRTPFTARAIHYICFVARKIIKNYVIWLLRKIECMITIPNTEKHPVNVCCTVVLVLSLTLKKKKSGTLRLTKELLDYFERRILTWTCL